MTRAVVARYAEEDGLDGNAEAAKVLPARRHLWRLCETYAPHLLAAALRARLSTADQTGRGGVRELRRALADWLDPPPACAHCGRLLSPDILAANPAGLPCPTRIAATSKPHKTGAGKSRRLLVCAPPRGPRPTYGTIARPGPGRASGLARCGTLALFAPTVLDPACAASVKMLKHGGASAYDLVVDRDARILFAVSDSAHCESMSVVRVVEMQKDRQHSEHFTTIAAARATFDRTLDRAVRANARLALKTQLKYFSPKGSITRADLVQAAMMGLRRALLDYDPNFTPAGKKSGVKISSYAIGWIHQRMGEEFADRDVVAVPQWAVALRRTVADMGISPGHLLAQVLAVSEARSSALLVHAVTGLAGMVLGVLAELPLECVDAGHDCAEGFKQSRKSNDHGLVVGVMDVGEAMLAVLDDGAACPVGVDGDVRDMATTHANIDAVHACHVSTAQRLLVAANKRPPKSKKPVTDEHSREQVAAVVADLLGLDCTGGALLTALRYGAPPRFVPVSTGGERDDADGAGDDVSGGNSGLEHLHARPDGEDEEDAAIAEAEDRRNMERLLTALAALRTTDPEAAEVVRRRHGLDVAGDEETLEQIGERLHSTGRDLCREAVRVAYKRGVKAMQVLAGASSLPLLGETGDAPTATADDEDITGPTRRRHSVFRPLRPANVRVILAAPPATYDNAPGDPEAWTAAAMVF